MATTVQEEFFSDTDYLPDKKKRSEDDSIREWYLHKCHVIVFTYSGKPVFTRYGDEHNLSGFTGTLSAIVAQVPTLFGCDGEKDSLRYIQVGNVMMSFLERGALWFVAITNDKYQRYTDIAAMLHCVYLQMISILTRSIEKTLLTKPGYDVRNLLGGTDSVICNYISCYQKELYSLVNGYESLPLRVSIRKVATNVLKSLITIPNSIGGLIIARKRVVASCFSPNTNVLPCDVVTLLNLIFSSKSLRQAESWTPICLSGVSLNAFLYAYIKFLTPRVAFVLLSATSDPRQFYAISDGIGKATNVLSGSGCLKSIHRSLQYCPYRLPSNVLGGIDLIHFAYYCQTVHQYFSSSIANSHTHKPKMKRIFKLYRLGIGFLFGAALPAQVYIEAKHEKTFVWKTAEFTLFLTVAIWTEVTWSFLCSLNDWIKTQYSFLFFSQ